MRCQFCNPSPAPGAGSNTLTTGDHRCGTPTKNSELKTIYWWSVWGDLPTGIHEDKK